MKSEWATECTELGHRGHGEVNAGVGEGAVQMW